MKSEFRKHRKKMLIQMIVLAVLCVAIAFVSWLAGRGTFTLHLMADLSDDDMYVEWEEGEIPVEEIKTLDAETIVVLKPKAPGAYTLTFRKESDEPGTLRYYDRIFVLPHGTTYSMSTGHFTGDTGIIGAIALLFAGTGLLCLISFFRMKVPEMYSYDAIGYFGAGIFCTGIGIMMIWLFVSRLLHPGQSHISSALMSIAGAGETFIFFTFPLVFVFAVAMIISNIALLRHEPFRIKNVLGLGIGVILIGSLFFLWSFLTRNFHGTAEDYHVFSTVNIIVAVAFAYFECVLTAAVVCGIRAASYAPALNQDYILILGCGLAKDGSLTPQLRGRVDKAAWFWQYQKDATGKEAVLVPCGGQGPDEAVSESEAMTRYLLSNGVSRNTILKEDKSKNTYENITFARAKILERENAKANDIENIKTMFVTTNYHVFRSGVWANMADVPSEGLGSSTKWWYWPNAFIRECVGLMVRRIPAEILWLAVIAAVFGGFSFLAFNINSIPLTISGLVLR